MNKLLVLSKWFNQERQPEMNQMRGSHIKYAKALGGKCYIRYSPFIYRYVQHLSGNCPVALLHFSMWKLFYTLRCYQHEYLRLLGYDNYIMWTFGWLATHIGQLSGNTISDYSMYAHVGMWLNSTSALTRLYSHWMPLMVFSWEQLPLASLWSQDWLLWKQIPMARLNNNSCG